MTNASPQYVLLVRSTIGPQTYYFYTMKSARHRAKELATHAGTRKVTLIGPDIETTVLFDGESK